VGAVEEVTLAIFSTCLAWAAEADREPRRPKKEKA
jgi:hypothetical protein